MNDDRYGGLSARVIDQLRARFADHNGTLVTVRLCVGCYVPFPIVWSQTDCLGPIDVEIDTTSARHRNDGGMCDMCQEFCERFPDVFKFVTRRDLMHRALFQDRE